MFRLLLFALVCLAVWKGYEHYRAVPRPAMASKPPTFDIPAKDMHANFSCDGRKYCSQMTSCSEATYFLKNCPGAKMDGNGDGVPCEQQWCR